ncbi:xylose isomerase domain-containing protein TIM barrel [Catenovulum agarivorans DS-2]|uniref:Xylose isomerase domain-containing protein TIM barrel n=1 Tax=Catenovulum agarivorans DS-2 TaxID=1328313 RepID=W7QHN9_9ALTE|nr:sugar phosphate isomerase/epimerase [Catenovulum agarivorans]EWH11396.1 xylose isomerase domain-containing protein TIM barrel [Catenovulum agarivorans DS-2]
MKNIIHTLKKLACVAAVSTLVLGCNATSTSTSKTMDSKEQMPKISVQLWSVKDDVKKDFKGTLTQLSKMGFQGVEFARDFGPYAQNPHGLKQFLTSLNLQASGAHVPFSALDDENFLSTVAFYKTLDCNLLIVPYDERAFSADGIEWVVAELNRLSDKLAAYGMKVGYHNHAQEFEAYKNSTYWDYMAQNTSENVVLQQDVGWTEYSGNDPVEYVRKYPGRTLTTHYKVRLPEGTQGKLPIIGKDTIDWPNLIKANKEVGGTLWLVVEQEEYPNGLTPLQAVAESKKGLDSFL